VSDLGGEPACGHTSSTSSTLATGTTVRSVSISPGSAQTTAGAEIAEHAMPGSTP
jgi:hypothetical protein